MFTEIILFLLDTVFTLFGMALLLRLWMQLTRLPSRNPVSQGVFQVTDWLVQTPEGDFGPQDGVALTRTLGEMSERVRAGAKP